MREARGDSVISAQQRESPSPGAARSAGGRERSWEGAGDSLPTDCPSLSRTWKRLEVATNRVAGAGVDGSSSQLATALATAAR